MTSGSWEASVSINRIMPIYTEFANTPVSPIRSIRRVTPSDSNDIDIPKILQFLEAGTVAVIFADDPDDAVWTYTFEGPVEQAWMVRKVLASGTTIADIRAGY